MRASGNIDLDRNAPSLYDSSRRGKSSRKSEPQEVLHTAKELHAAKEKTNRKLRTFLETKKSLPAGASEGSNCDRNAATSAT